MSAVPLDLPSAPGWQHSTCCDVLFCCKPQGCCGCLDRGVCYVVTHSCCLPCTFGRLAQVGAGRDYHCCCIGFALGFALGACVTGHAVLPCAMSVRRALVHKYSLAEGWCTSFLHIWCCPFVSVLQMAMEVEEREVGTLGAYGYWAPQASLHQALTMDRS